MAVLCELLAEMPAAFAVFCAFAAAAAKDNFVASKVSAAGKAYLLQSIKILMARQIWRTEGYYQLQNATDSTVAKALQQLK